MPLPWRLRQDSGADGDAADCADVAMVARSDPRRCLWRRSRIAWSRYSVPTVTLPLRGWSLLIRSALKTGLQRGSYAPSPSLRSAALEERWFARRQPGPGCPLAAQRARFGNKA